MKTIYSLLLVFLVQYVKSESDLQFWALPLCDSAVLVYWRPKENESEGTRYTFSHKEFQGYDYGPERRDWRVADPNEGHIRLNDFKENTRYRIIVYKEKRNEPTRLLYFLDTKTREIDFIEPGKPDFDYKIFHGKISDSLIKIIWYPCGREYKCVDEAPGCSFYVKYRMKGAKEFRKIFEFYEDYVYIRDCLPGKVYEFIVGSSNVPSEAESGTKEIIVPPEADPVSNFEALLLGSFSILLTWDPPHKFNGNLTGYKIFYEDKEKPYKFIYPEKYDNIAPSRTRIILSRLQPNTTYRVSVAARTDIGLGTVSSIDIHASKLENPTSAPFKPQALINITDTILELPKVKITWLPCGAEKNCQGQNAGSYFEVKYKLENESSYAHLSEHDQDFVVIENLLPNSTYEFIVVSVDQALRSESDVHKVYIPYSGQRVYEISQGNNITLPCSSNSASELKFTPKWLKNDLDLTLGKSIQQLNTDLLLKNVSIKDSGKYACTIPSSPLKIDDLVFLSVKKRTIVNLRKKSDRQELKVAEKFSLHCETITDPSLSIYSYKWLKDGNRIDFNASISLVKTEINELQFSNTSLIDSGNYTCMVSTRLDSASGNLEIIVLPS